MCYYVTNVDKSYLPYKLIYSKTKNQHSPHTRGVEGGNSHPWWPPTGSSSQGGGASNTWGRGPLQGEVAATQGHRDEERLLHSWHNSTHAVSASQISAPSHWEKDGSQSFLTWATAKWYMLTATPQPTTSQFQISTANSTNSYILLDVKCLGWNQQIPTFRDIFLKVSLLSSKASDLLIFTLPRPQSAELVHYTWQACR